MGEENGSNGFSSRYATIIQTVTVVGLFIGGFWGAVISPITSKIYTIEQTTISLREHDEFKRAIEKRLDNNEAELLRLRTIKISKDDSNRSFGVLEQKIIHQQGEIKDVRDALVGSGSLKDIISSLQKQVDDLRSKLLAPKSND